MNTLFLKESVAVIENDYFFQERTLNLCAIINKISLYFSLTVDNFELQD